MSASSTIQFLNSNSGAIQAIATVVLVAITAYYAIQTKFAVNEASNARKDVRLPIIRVGIVGPFNDANGKMFRIPLKNVGYGIARRISISFPRGETSLVRSLDEGMEHSAYITLSKEDYDGIAGFPDSKKIVNVEYLDIFSRKMRTVAEFVIEKNDNGKTEWRVAHWNPVLPE